MSLFYFSVETFNIVSVPIVCLLYLEVVPLVLNVVFTQ